MSYSINYRGGSFCIKRAMKQRAADALRRYKNESGYDIPQSDTLEEILSECCWNAETNVAGDIVEMYLEDNVLGDEEEWMEVIAPFVKPGSWLAFEGEDGYIWCYYFDGEHCSEHHGVITFPTVPKNNLSEVLIET